MNDEEGSSESRTEAPAERRARPRVEPTKHEEARARIIAAQAAREAADVLARGPLGSARRKARTNWAASESQPPRRPLGRPPGPRK